VRVTLPAAAPEADAEKLLRSKSAWLLRHVARFDRLRKIVPDRRFVSGERLPYLDETLILEVATGPARVYRRDGSLVVSARYVRRAVEDWYFTQAQGELSRRVGEVTKRFGIKIRGVRISRAKTRWGSCSSTGWININWRLMLAPSRIVDYLIAHELSHVAHKNHSAAFWARVAELHPAYPESERWLRKFGAGLVLQVV
jgi:predicted metal-dependent hydrolase